MTPAIDFSNTKYILSNLTREMFLHADFLEDGYGQLDRLERIFLYNFVKMIAPTRAVVEFSSATGASTAIIGKAIEKRDIPFHTHEIDQQVAREAETHLNALEITGCTINVGDVFQTLKRAIWSRCDFVFIDSDHKKTFCERYASELLPLLKDCWVGVHDIVMEGPYANEESQIIKKFVLDNKVLDYFLITDVLKIFNIPNPPRDWPHNPSFYFKIP